MIIKLEAFQLTCLQWLVGDGSNKAVLARSDQIRVNTCLKQICVNTFLKHRKNCECCPLFILVFIFRSQKFANSQLIVKKCFQGDSLLLGVGPTDIGRYRAVSDSGQLKIHVKTFGNTRLKNTKQLRGDGRNKAACEI